MNVVSMGRILTKDYDKEIFENSIKFIRDPTEEERIEFGRIRFQKRVDGALGKKSAGPLGAESEELLLDDLEDFSDDDDDACSTQDTKDFGSGSWRPDESLHNQVYDFVHASGLAGASSAVRHFCVILLRS